MGIHLLILIIVNKISMLNRCYLIFKKKREVEDGRGRGRVTLYTVINRDRVTRRVFACSKFKVGNRDELKGGNINPDEGEVLESNVV